MGYFESHFDRYRPEVRNRWREQGGPGSGIWYDLGPHLLDQVVNLFGLPVSISVDLAQLRPGAQATDYFHAVLAYPQRRVVLHGTLLAAAETARYIVHGSRASYVKYGLGPQEERLKNGERLPQEDWGYDMRDGVLTRVEGKSARRKTGSLCRVTTRRTMLPFATPSMAAAKSGACQPGDSDYGVD